MIKMKDVDVGTGDDADKDSVARIHGGFWDALHTKRAGLGTSIMDEILRIIESIDQNGEGAPKKIYITGHSLGGALRYQLSEA